MGASFSAQVSAESNMELRKHIDAAVTKVILDSTFTDLTNLANEKKCNRLVKKATRVFQQSKDTVDLELLRQQLYNNQTHVEGRVKTSEKHNDSKIKTPQIQNVKKKCLQISKFYVLFAHLFACIISTMNPSFKIESNKKEKTKEEKETPSLDFCTHRIEELVNRELNENSDGDFLVKPNICKTNLSKNGDPLRFTDLPGMKALQELYKSDTDEMEKEDARFLYTAFTGKDAPDTIRHMDQIPLKTYNNDEECRGQKGGVSDDEDEKKREERRDKERRDLEKERMFYYYNERDRKKNDEENARIGIYLKGVVGSLKERLFSEYVQHIKEMIQRAESNRSNLLEILSEMFVYTYDESGGGNINGVVINPSLTYNKLQSLVVRTRRIVINLYTDCEEDYKTGLDIFFAIVQEKIAMKLSVQEASLKKQLYDVMYDSPELYVPESLLYQQYRGAEEFNKNQFIPRHFKSSVKSIVKNNLTDYDFKQILPSLNEWINEEMENATTLLDPQNVAEEFLKQQYGDEYESPPNTNEEYVGSPSPYSDAVSFESSSSAPPPPPVSSDSSSSTSPPPARTSTRSFAPASPARTSTRSFAPASPARTYTRSFAPASSTRSFTPALKRKSTFLPMQPTTLKFDD